MGSKRSKEDDVSKISTSVFITNFPELFNAKDLWNVCKQYGNIVDAYILNKRSKVVGPKFVEAEVNNIPALVLDEDCLNQQEYSNSLLGKVMIEFQLEETKKKFTASVGVGVWFSQLQQASKEFTLDGRVTWVEIEGVPLKMWSENTFNRIASKWGTLLHVDDQDDGCFHRRRVCINTTIGTNIFESFKIIYKVKVCWIRAKEVPGWTPEFVENNEDVDTDDESYERDFVGEKGVNNIGTLLMRTFQTEDQKQFQRMSLNTGSTKSKNNLGENLFNKGENHNNKGSNNASNSYAYAVKVGPKSVQAEVDNIPALVLDEDCLNQQEYSNSLLGKVKELNTLSNLKMVLVNKGGSILQLMDDLVKAALTMGFNMEGCLTQKAKKDWVKELCMYNKVNVLSLQETKMETIESISIKMCWGNFAFDFVYSASVGNSGGILCMWDPRCFHKSNATISDYFIMIRGVWVPNGKNLLIISVYAPQELSEKKMLWDYLTLVIANWKGGVVMMGDFNEVHKKEERFGSNFNVQRADAFNFFISNAGLEEVPSGGYSFTWCRKSASKMSKLDRFLIFENLMNTYPNISAITLDRYLSDHRPILLRESKFDYGPIPFRFFNYWFEVEGFDKFVEETWTEAPLDKLQALEAAQKAKIKWAIEEDENSKYYHGILNKKRNQLTSRGILVDGIWIESPSLVKSEFLSHFKNQFDQPQEDQFWYNINFLNKLSSDQQADLEIEVSKEEIKRAVWDYEIDKSPGPDCFTFGFYRRYWKLIEIDVVNAVTYFFHHCFFPKGGNSSFIALISKTTNANMVKDFRPISLIGSLYKIVANIFANPFSKKKQSVIFKVDFEKAYDSVHWEYLDDIMKKFGFGERWCGWIQSFLRSSRGSVIVNGSPTKEFQFYKGLKQGDPLSPFLFILVMKSLHISFQKVVDASMFKGIALDPSLHLSHMFYVDDTVFVGKWSESNIDIIVHVLDCFYRALCLRINMKRVNL
ncbi:RNA-directed DNA polymerase, eukaryota [Tanacetum coccineum]